MIQSNNAKPPASATVRQSVGQVLYDLLTLVELQWRLFKSDVDEFTEQTARPAAVLAVGALLLAAMVPVCFLAIAEGLVVAGVPRAIAHALVALAGVVSAAGMVTWAWRRIRSLPAALARSQEELMQNITWLKEAVKDSRFTSCDDEAHGHDRPRQYETKNSGGSSGNERAYD